MSKYSPPIVLYIAYISIQFLLPILTTSFPVGEVIRKILNTYPHDDQCFTQGLVINNGKLYESCGLYGKSSLRVVDMNTFKVIKKQVISKDIFAEGLVAINNLLFMITWKNKKMIIFDSETLKPLATRTYQTHTGEGWGLTTDGKSLIFSDGSEKLTFFDIPSLTKEELSGTSEVAQEDILAMSPTKQIRVFDPINGRHLQHINELEFVAGSIYANIWYKDVIVRINSTTGRVEERYDASKVYPKDNRHPRADCLNGIAYDPVDGTMLLTGKNWPKYYRINFTEMDARNTMEL